MKTPEDYDFTTVSATFTTVSATLMTHSYFFQVVPIARCDSGFIHPSPDHPPCSVLTSQLYPGTKFLRWPFAFHRPGCNQLLFFPVFLHACVFKVLTLVLR